MGQKIDDLKEKYTDEVFLENFKALFSLRRLFYNSIIKENYNVPFLIGEKIILTEFGNNMFKQIKEGRFKGTEEHLIKFAFLMVFYRDELFIDVLKTEKNEIESLLNKQILDNSLLYPWIYGRLLYDKYFEDFEEQESSLQNKDVIKLLDQTYKGVFQVSNYVIGPLGLLKSNTNRYLPPTRKLKLWHCSDPSCQAFHEVRFLSDRNIIPDLISEINDLLINIPSSDWGSFYLDLLQSDDFFYDSNRLSETPYLFINALGNSEVKSLLKEIIDTDKGFRNLLPNLKSFKGSSEDIVKNLAKDVCFQLILLENDEDIIKSVERLIAHQVIFIPPTEIRRPFIKQSRGFYGIYHECNKLGVRSMSGELNLGLRRLNNLLNKIYSEPIIQQQLDWKLRFYDKETVREKIETYTMNEEPHRIVRETVLSGALQINHTFKYLFGNFEMPTTPEEEEILVDKILWKLGFDINIYPNNLSKFWQRLQNFKDTIRTCIGTSDIEKEKIRSASINFWISLEELLEQTLSFITWVLLSDHYRETHFKYNFEEARSLMCSKLNGQPIGSGEKLILDENGKNTLFPLTEGFSVLLDVCNRLFQEGYEKYSRSVNEMPSFWHKADLVTFPFESKIHLFNLKQSNYKVLNAIICEIPKSFSRNNVLSVRNKTQHKGNDFPSQDELLTACNAVEEIISNIEINSIYPNVYLFKKSSTDKFNRVTFEFEDYKGRNITLRPTFEFTGSNLPRTRTPQIIMPILNIGSSQELLRFDYKESSSYLKFWKDFPRKKEKKKKKENVQHEENTTINED